MLMISSFETSKRSPHFLNCFISYSELSLHTPVKVKEDKTDEETLDYSQDVKNNSFRQVADDRCVLRLFSNICFPSVLIQKT